MRGSQGTARRRRVLKRAGVTVKVAASGHLHLTCPDGSVVVSGLSSSCSRVPKELASELRRHGVDIHWKQLL